MISQDEPSPGFKDGLKGASWWTAMRTSDVAVIGGGAVGTASAMAIPERFPGITLTLLEKEDRLATHQTGIDDYAEVTRRYGEVILSRGGMIHTGCRVNAIERTGSDILLRTSQGTLPTHNANRFPTSSATQLAHYP